MLFDFNLQQYRKIDFVKIYWYWANVSVFKYIFVFSNDWKIYWELFTFDSLNYQQINFPTTKTIGFFLLKKVYLLTYKNNYFIVKSMYSCSTQNLKFDCMLSIFLFYVTITIKNEYIDMSSISVIYISHILLGETILLFIHCLRYTVLQ